MRSAEKAAGLMAAHGDDYPLCCRHLAYAWRMFTAYPEKELVVIVALDKHDRAHNPASELAEALPSLSVVGRRRSDKPPCCDDADEPPTMNDELRELLGSIA